MKPTALFLIGLLALGQCLFHSGFAQCIDVDEDDFTGGAANNICADLNTPMANASAGTVDVWDLGVGAAGADGTADIMLTYDAVWMGTSGGACTASAANNQGIAASWGGGALGCTGASSGSDFGGTLSDDCQCTYGYIKMTVDFINGFGAEAGTFMWDATSQNGSSEGFEGAFGWVSAAEDAAGNPINGLPAPNLGMLGAWCNAQYVAGTRPSTHLGFAGGGFGEFTTQADDLNATPNNCATDGQGGEDTGSGSGPNSTLGTGVSGLAPTDVIKQVCYVYLLSNAPGSDCDGDNDSGVGTNPSGSFAGMELCPPPPPCSVMVDSATAACNGINADVTVTFTDMNLPAGSAWDILDATGAMVATGVTSPATFTIAGPTTAAPGTPFTLVNNMDANCMAMFMVDIPECNCILNLTCPTDVMTTGCLADYVPALTTDATVTPMPDAAACDPIMVTVSEEGPMIVGDPCNGGSYMWIRTFTATALGGAVQSVPVSCQQTYTITPEGFTLTCPAAVAVECPGDVPAPDIAMAMVAGTPCGTPTVTHVGDVSNGASGCLGSPIMIERAYQAVDADGCVRTCIQMITVEEMTARVLVCPETPIGLSPAPAPGAPVGPVGAPSLPVVTGPCP